MQRGPGDKLTVNAGDDINITQNGDKDYTISVDPSLREEIEEGYTAADSALRTEITEAYQQADSALKADIDKNSETIGEIGSVLGGAENGYKKPTFDTVTANDINVGKINISPSRSGRWRLTGRITALPLESSPTAYGDSI